MKVLSLFDGISCARVALERAGILVEAYYASEIDKYAIQISKKNYLDIIQMGSVTDLRFNSDMKSEPPKNIDLLIGGSPCQDLSIAKKGRKGLYGERSGLFWEYVRILKEVKPKYFILENVASMPKEAKDIITKELGVEPIMINAALVSAQNRKRLFWVGKLDEFGTYYQVHIPQPEDMGILLKDILEDGFVDRDKSHCIDANYHKGASWQQYKEKGRRQLVVDKKYFLSKNTLESTYSWNNAQAGRIRGIEHKSVTLQAGGGGTGAKTGLYAVPYKHETGAVIERVRKLTPIECERLQGLPDNYTDGISNTQRYKCLGNAFNVDVVSHILSHLVV